MANRTYVCLDCHTARRAVAAHGRLTEFRCHLCRQPLSELDRKRRIPAKDDAKGWKELRVFVLDLEATRADYVLRDGIKKMGEIDRKIELTQRKPATPFNEKNLKQLKFQRQKTRKEHRLV